MKRLDHLRSLDRADWKLFARAFVVVVAVRAALSVVSVGRVLRAVESRAAARGGSPRPSVERIVWAVGAASRRVPRATCLTRALAAKLLLAERGVASTLHFGFRRTPARALEGHAWLQYEGRIIVGDEELERYTQLESAQVKNA